MRHATTRRDFLAMATATGAGLLAARRAAAAAAPAPDRFLKALIVKDIDEKVLASYKAAGFDGVECSDWNVEPAAAEKARAVAEKCGMKIHSVMRAWLDFNQADKLEADVKSVETALNAAAGYGADAVLMVPCRLKGGAVPAPSEFDIDLDEKTGHVARVVKGDNAKYAEYIQAQNHATDVSREALKRLAPAAEKAKVAVAVENVWNNLWVKPALAASFVRSVGSPWVRFYFDVGNHVKYAPPEEWIRALGDMIVKVHIKDFKLGGKGGGKFVDIRDGDVNWPAVLAELGKVGYKGWMTIEGSGGLSLEEKSKRLDLIIAGK